MVTRDAGGRFLPSYLNDPFDPRGWDDPLPYKPIFLSEKRDVFCVVSLEDYEWALGQIWFATHSRFKQYAARSVRRDGKHQLVWLHKEILLRTGLPPSPRHHIGDHMNGNSLDNRRSNLRWATVDENNRNKHGFYVKQLSLFEGLHLHA